MRRAVLASCLIASSACGNKSAPSEPCGHWRELAFPAGTEFHQSCDDDTINGRTHAPLAAFVKMFTDRGYVASRGTGATYAKSSQSQYVVHAGDPNGVFVFVDTDSFTLSRRPAAEIKGGLTEQEFAQLSDDEMRKLHGAAIKRAKALVPLIDKSPGAPKVCAGAAGDVDLGEDAIVLNLEGPELGPRGQGRGPYSIGGVRAPGEYAASDVTDLINLRGQLNRFMAAHLVPVYRLKFAAGGTQTDPNAFWSGGARIEVAVLDEAAGTVRCRTVTSARNSETVTAHSGRNDSAGERGIAADQAISTDLDHNIGIAVRKALSTMVPAP